MTVKLFCIPNIKLLFENINQCAGHVYLEWKDKRFLNLKNGGDGERFLKSAGNQANGFTILMEKSEDAALILRALL